jgi:peptide/nickel transport system substrate-binding protein
MANRRIILAALVTAALIPASARQGLAAPKTDLVVGMAAQDVGKLDPHLAVSTIDRTVVAWMFNGLVRFKPGSMTPADIEPDLATSWEFSPDKKVWTFHLRHGVKFHGGYGEVTADDVVYSLAKAADPKRSASSGDYTAFEKVEAIDPYTVRITLKQTLPSLLGILTNYSGGFIVSKKAVEEMGDKFNAHPYRHWAVHVRVRHAEPVARAGGEQGLLPRCAEDPEDQLPLPALQCLARPCLSERRDRPRIW